jgi:hypothetical protein
MNHFYHASRWKFLIFASMNRLVFFLYLIILLSSKLIFAQGATHIWSKAWGYEHDGENSFEINDLAHDLEGNVYMFGKILGSVDLDPGLDTSESLITEHADPYIIKLNSSGEFLWAKNFEGTLILVSHDRDFLRGFSQKVFEFKDKRVIEHFESIDAFLERNKMESLKALG